VNVTIANCQAVADVLELCTNGDEDAITEEQVEEWLVLTVEEQTGVLRKLTLPVTVDLTTLTEVADELGFNQDGDPLGELDLLDFFAMAPRCAINVEGGYDAATEYYARIIESEAVERDDD
jgi:hypothetical protein